MGQTAVQRFYRFQALIYDSTRWTILHGRRRAAAALGLRPNDSVLEIGCGTGLNFRFLLDYLDPQAGRLTGLDFSADMLRVAERRVQRRGWQNVNLVHGDATKMELGQQFDGVFFGYSITMIPDFPAAIDRAAAHLKPGGTLVALDFSRFEGWGPFAALARWYLRANHVETLRPYEDELRRRFTRCDVTYWLGGYNFTAVCRKGA